MKGRRIQNPPIPLIPPSFRWKLHVAHQRCPIPLRRDNDDVTLAATWQDWLQRVSPQPGEAALYALRTWIASMLALFIAFELQLDAPYWAWVTVWIVSQPNTGMMLSKSFYRAIGTICGAGMAVILIALFAQTPELFVLALALIVAGCTVASNLLTNFRAYATVLSAYTAGIVAADAINQPEQVWYIALARASCILIGIASAVTVASIFAPHRSEAATHAKFITLLKEAAARTMFSYRGDNQERLKIGRQLIVDAIALDTLLEFAAAESERFRVQKNRARSVLAHVFGMISARRSLDARLIRHGWPNHHALQIFHEVVLDHLAEIPAHLDRGDVDGLVRGLEEVRAQLARQDPERDTVDGAELVSERYVMDRLDDMLAHWGCALRDWRSILHGAEADDPRLVLNFHRDHRAAAINGLRAFLAVSATGAFWIASAWPHGPSALVFVAIMLSLFSSVPRPDRVGWQFFYVSIPAVVIALLLKFFVLPQQSSFEFLSVAMGFILLPLGMIMYNPKTTQPAVAFSLIFLNTAAPTNPMTYDLADSLNTALGTEIGVLFGTLSYVILFPPNPAAALRYVTHRIGLGLALMARRVPIPDFAQWETRMYDRVLRLNDPLNLSGTATNEWLDAALSALTLGNEILRLRHHLERRELPGPVAPAAAAVVESFSDFADTPARAHAEVRARLVELSAHDPGLEHPGRRAWAQTLGSVEEINGFLSRIPGS
jgi:uncharacterized membrane protein YccC